MWLGAPLDPKEGERYIELVKTELDTKEIDNLYNIKTRREESVNPIADG